MQVKTETDSARVLAFIKKNIRLVFEFGSDSLQRKEKWQCPIL